MPLRLIDDFFYFRNRIMANKAIVVGAKVCSTSVTATELLPHLRNLVSRRKTLRCNFNAVDVKEITWDVSSSIETLAISDPREALEVLHNTFFPADSDLPLWKLVCAQDGWIFFVFDHLLCDGTTGVMVLEDLILLSQGAEIVPDTDIGDLFDRYIRPSTWFIVKFIASQIGSSLWSFFYGKRGTDEARGASIDTKASRHLLRIDAEEMKIIKKLTHKENVTFTGFLAIVNVMVLSKLTGQASIKVNIPVNQRRFLGEPRAYGNLVSGADIETPFPVDWNLLKKSVTLTEAAMKESAQMVGMLAYVSTEEYVKKSSENLPDKSTIEISNIGLRSIAPSITEYVFSQPRNLFSKNVVNSVVSSSTSTTITMSFGFGNEFFVEYQRYFCAIMKEISKRGDAGMSFEDCVRFLDVDLIV